MGMNAISMKAAAAAETSESSSKRRKRRSRRREARVEESAHYQTDEFSITVLEGLDYNILKQLSEATFKPVNLEELKKRYEHVGGLGRRIAPRFALKMSTVVFNSKGSFKTETMNISSSGVLLRDTLPDTFMNGDFDILLIHENPDSGQKSHLLFRGEAVGGPLRSGRVTFRSAAKSAVELLHKLFSDMTPLIAV